MKLYPSLSDDLAEWAQRQPVFFTGSAPTHGPHINVSPKGLADSHFAVLSPNQCAYIDRTGSGCETIAHSYENGRLCLMFMSFGPAPRIMRLFCTSSVVEWDDPRFQDLVRKIAKGKREVFDGARAVIICDIWEAQTSCGFAVPRIKQGIYSPDEDQPSTPIEDILRQGIDRDQEKLDELAVFEARPTLDKWEGNMVEAGKMIKYQAENNASSMDGLPGLRAARRDVGQKLWLVDAQAWARRIAAEKEALAVGFGIAILLYLSLLGIGVL